MLISKFQEFLIILFNVVYIYGQFSYYDCITPDLMQGSCVPIGKCRRIEWMLNNWSAPYPDHMAEYIRRSHCGTQGKIHYACCAYYDINGHMHQTSRVTTNPSGFVHSPQHPFHSGPSQYQQNFVNTQNPLHSHRPTANYVQQPLGERILRSMPCGALNGDRISNGDIVRLSEFPWMVLIESEGIKSRERFRCAGTLITNQFILTAAHCAEPKNDVISIRLGEHNLKTKHDCEHYKKSHVVSQCAPPYEDIAIERIFLHPDFKSNPLQSDIALIRLVRPVEFQTHIKPICLPLDAHVMAKSLPMEQIVAGWGVTEKGYASDVLLKALLPIQPLAVCQKAYGQSASISPLSLCAGGFNQRSTCRADSGGPLFTAVPYEHHQRRYVQFGVTSAGSFGCGSKHNLPGIYTSVTSFMPWIIGTIY